MQLIKLVNCVVVKREQLMSSIYIVYSLNIDLNTHGGKYSSCEQLQNNRWLLFC